MDTIITMPTSVYDELMRTTLHQSGLKTGKESEPVLDRLMDAVYEADFYFKFSAGNRSIVLDIYDEHKQHTYNVSIILYRDTYEILITLVGGERGKDVRNEWGNTSHHETDNEVVEELRFFNDHWIYGRKKDKIGSQLVCGTHDELDRWKHSFSSTGKMYIPKDRILKNFE
jgi:hypothetical protein